MKIEEDVRIISNEKVAEEIYEMKMESIKISQKVNAGQFIHILCGGDQGALLRRPFSLSRIDRDKGEISILYRVQGKGTKNLLKMLRGQRVNALGPLGQGFSLDSSYNKIAVVGGGIGMAPLMEIIKYYGKASTVYLGFQKEPIMLHEIGKYTNEMTIVTEKGKAKKKGLITEGLKEDLRKKAPQIVYTCGPKKMMEKVFEICEELNIPCQVSMEEKMGCGIGACLVCSCKTKKKEQKNIYSKVCKDGPVYWGEEVLWNE